MSGYGSQVLRKIHIDPQTHRMDVIALENALHEDKAMGRIPLMIFATAGTVDTGAIDDLEGIAALGKREGVWVHVDGAFGALGVLSHTVKPLLRGISNVDSIALDFHKWGQVPYSAGMIVVRNGQTLRQCFSSPANYLSREKSGLMSGEWWPCKYCLFMYLLLVCGFVLSGSCF
jgi:glutamate/tyrosine decarboxylase-like PLP-dependent enzyme